ncbi:MAG TPA: class I SAM-dependent methyltransferase [Roseiflexaceae bacterium]|nr:class I SAM-dependent methyltransferase [Roseiflexaceae bacterium]
MPVQEDPAREAELTARIDAWLAHMTWRPDYAAWRAGRIWQERNQAGRLRMIEQYGGSITGSRILDLGSGMGGTAVALALAGAQVTAFEYNRAYCDIIRLRAARYALQLPVINGAGEALPLPDAAFDTAICWDVVEHVQNPDALLAELARVVRPGGQILITVINRLAFRDPHYHLPLINWIPRPLAEQLIERYGRSKQQAAFRDMQRLSEMHYYTLGAFRRRARHHGLRLLDIGEDALRRGEARAGGLKGLTRDLLRRVGVALPAYRLYRTFFQGTFELVLARDAHPARS